MIRDLQNRVQRLEQLVLMNRDAQHTAHNGSLSQSLHELGNRVSSIEQQLTRNNTELGSQDSCIPAPTLRMKTSLEKTRLAGQSHWSNSFQQLRMLEKIDDRQAAEMREGMKKCKGLRATLKHKPMMWDEPFKQLAVDVAWGCGTYIKMVGAYFRTFGPIYRILHPSFRDEYMDRLAFETEPPPHSFILKALLVIGVGSVFHPDDALRKDIHMRVHRWVYAAQWWLTGPAEKSAYNLDGLQVYCLMLLCRQVHSLNKESVWLSAGSLVRFACSLGLHRDPGHFSSLSVCEGDMRRRLWAAVLEIALHASFDVSMPPLISEDDFDTKPPLNVNDREMDEDIQSAPSPKPSSHHTDASIQLLLLKTLPARLQVARFSNQIGQPQSYEQALRLGTELMTFCKDITTYFQVTPNLPESADFHHRILDTFLRRTILFLYRPFALQALHDPRFYLARKFSLESAMVIASYADTVDIPSKQLDDFTKLSISGFGAFKGALSIDPIITICLELVTQLDEEARTRLRIPRNGPDNVLDRMARASRKPLIETLEHIQEQLLQVIAMGIPSMKRYAILSTVMGQIKAMERTGQWTKEDVHGALMESIKKCSSALEEHIEVTGSGTSGSVDPGTSMTSDLDVDSLVC